MANQRNWSLFFTAICCLLSQTEAQSSQLGRIIGGNFASPGQFPYQVFYDIANRSQYSQIWHPHCGGTIISNNIILTAAHCVALRKFDLALIYFGAVDKSNKTEVGQERLQVTREDFVVHKDFSLYPPPVHVVHDIALIRLPIELKFNQYIQPAKLPEPNNLYENQLAYVSGWGAIANLYGNRKFTIQLLKYYVTPILIYKFCQDQYKICSLHGTDSACNGDSGGPLAIRNSDGSAIVVGIVSHGSDEFCTPTVWAYFTQVSSYLDWIGNAAGAAD